MYKSYSRLLYTSSPAGARSESMRKNSIKNIRINSEVQRELSSIIRNQVKDPRISSLVSVTSVAVAPDLKTCSFSCSHSLLPPGCTRPAGKPWGSGRCV